jgi:hypothetical protein
MVYNQLVHSLTHSLPLFVRFGTNHREKNNIKNPANNSLTGSIPKELGRLARFHNLTSLYLAGNDVLVEGDVLAQLSGVLYRECEISGCRPRDDTENPGACEAFEQNQKMTIDNCGRFRESCFAC